MAKEFKPLNEAQIEQIARIYDGRSETIDKLVRRFGAPRWRIGRVAKERGYRSKRKRVVWTFALDTIIRESWGRLPIEEIAARTGASELACRLRAKRLGVSSRNLEDPTIRTLEEYTRIDHRQWHWYIERGWLTAWKQPRTDAPPATRVSVDSLHRLLRKKPEIYDYENAPVSVRSALQLDKLPAPPAFKRVTCRSDHWSDRERLTAVGPRGGGQEQALVSKMHMYSMESCEAVGGTTFWTAMYDSEPSCPRCGCRVSRYSEGDGEYSDEDHGEGDVLAAVAGKLGLRWVDGQLVDADNCGVHDERLLALVFDGKRKGNRAFSAFRRLLASGLNIGRPTPVPDERWAPDITGMKLRNDQQEAFAAFREEGRVGIYTPPGQGKSSFARYVMTRLPGEHIVFVHSTVLRDDWINAFKALPVRVESFIVDRPNLHAVIVVYDTDGAVRCRVNLFNYKTRADFSRRKFVVRVFDEAQFLPGNEAVKLLYRVDAEFQLSLTATPFREDCRASMIDVISARTVGGDWQPYRDRGDIPDVPVDVVIVPNEDLKIAALRSLIDARERTMIFSDSIALGKAVEREVGIPFVHATSKRKLQTIKENRVVAVSRTADCGISINDVEHVAELSFQKGARAQSVQRHGRLLHSKSARKHTVLMTPEELTKHFKRLTVLEEKGCRMKLRMLTGLRGRQPTTTPIKLKAMLKAPARRQNRWCDVLPLAA